MTDQFTLSEHTDHFKAIVKEAPQIVLRLREEEFEKGKAEGYEAGVDAERTRMLEILDASIIQTEDGRVIFEGFSECMQMLKDGTSAADCYKKLLEAVKDKRAKGLSGMKAEATEAVEQEETEDVPAASGVDAKFMDRVKELRNAGKTLAEANDIAKREFAKDWKLQIDAT